MCRNCALLFSFNANNRPSGLKPFSVFERGRRHFLSAGIKSAASLGLAMPLVEAAMAAPAVDAGSHEATVVLRGGKVYTVEPQQPWAQAVAIKGNRIVAVGSDADVSRLVGPRTKVIELDGRMLLPGFVEAHIHPTLGSFFTGGVDLQLPTGADALAAIAQYARQNPDAGHIRGFGWRQDMFGPDGPTKEELDRVVPDRPAFFFNIDVHSLWMNSKAMQAAGVTRQTPDPIPGFSYFKRDSNGEPTGYVLETAAVMSVVAKLEPLTYESLGSRMQQWLPKAAAAGITTVFDAGAMPIDDDQSRTFGLYLDLERQQKLPVRVKVSYMVSKPDVDEEVRRAISLRPLVNSELVQFSALKIIGDGTAEGHTALMLDPYTDRPDIVVTPPYSKEQLDRMVRQADAAGLDVHIHAFGDGIARMALDAIEAAIRENPVRDRRHSLAHLVYVSDEDCPRFGKLGVIAQFSANWMSADPDTTVILPARLGSRAHYLVRPKTIMDSGGIVAFGTDWPAAGFYSTYKPLESIQVAVTRQLLNKPDAPILQPEGERLSLEQAIRANTLGGAYQLRMEDSIGTIKPGKLADLVVLEQNLFDVDPHEIGKVRVDLTMMNGRLTFSPA